MQVHVEIVTCILDVSIVTHLTARKCLLDFGGPGGVHQHDAIHEQDPLTLTHCCHLLLP
jgi:hypothetical protein